MPLVFFAARLAPSILGLVTTSILTHLLRPADYGMYALGLSAIFLLTTGGFEWLGLSLLRLSPAAEDAEQFFGTLLFCFLAVCGISGLGVALVALAGGLKHDAAFAAACLLAAIASAWIELKQRLQLAELRERDYFKTNLARGVAVLLCVPVVAYVHGSPTLMLLALGASTLLTTVVTREPHLNFAQARLHQPTLLAIVRFGFPLSISVGLATILMSVDKWLLQLLSGPHAVGLFAAATLVTQVPVMTLAGGMGTSGYSMAVRALERESAASARVQLAQNFTLLFGLVMPAATGIVALSTNLAHALVGPSYWHAVVVLAPWLAAGSVLSSLRAFYVDGAFQLAHRPMTLVWTTIFAIAVNILLDLRLIPQLGERGAAIGSFGAILISLIIVVILSRRVFPLPLPWLDATKILASTVIMFLALRGFALSPGPVHLIAQIVLGCLVYGAVNLAVNTRGLRDAAFALWRHSFHVSHGRKTRHLTPEERLDL